MARASAAAIAGAGSTTPDPTGTFTNGSALGGARQLDAVLDVERHDPVAEAVDHGGRIGATDRDPEDVDLEVDARRRGRPRSRSITGMPSSTAISSLWLWIAQAQAVLRGDVAGGRDRVDRRSRPPPRSASPLRAHDHPRRPELGEGARGARHRLPVVDVGPGVRARDREPRSSSTRRAAAGSPPGTSTVSTPANPASGDRRQRRDIEAHARRHRTGPGRGTCTAGPRAAAASGAPPRQRREPVLEPEPLAGERQEPRPALVRRRHERERQPREGRRRAARQPRRRPPSRGAVMSATPVPQQPIA